VNGSWGERIALALVTAGVTAIAMYMVGTHEHRESSFEELEAHLSTVTANQNNVIARLERIENRLDRLDSRIDELGGVVAHVLAREQTADDMGRKH